MNVPIGIAVVVPGAGGIKVAVVIDVSERAIGIEAGIVVDREREGAIAVAEIDI